MSELVSLHEQDPSEWSNSAVWSEEPTDFGSILGSTVLGSYGGSHELQKQFVRSVAEALKEQSIIGASYLSAGRTTSVVLYEPARHGDLLSPADDPNGFFFPTMRALLALSPDTPSWLNQALETVTQRSGDEQPLSVRRAYTGALLLHGISSLLREPPFVYPSPGDTLTIDLLRDRSRFTIIHDGSFNQIISITSTGLESEMLPVDEITALRDAIQVFYGS